MLGWLRAIVLRGHMVLTQPGGVGWERMGAKIWMTLKVEIIASQIKVFFLN